MLSALSNQGIGLPVRNRRVFSSLSVKSSKNASTLTVSSNGRVTIIGAGVLALTVGTTGGISPIQSWTYNGGGGPSVTYNGFEATGSRPAIIGTNASNQGIGLITNQHIHLSSNGFVKWTNFGDYYQNWDVGLTRNAAGVIEVNSGTASALRDLTCRSLLPIAQAATDIPLNVTLAAAQSANAFNITSNGGTAGDIFKITSSGYVTAAANITANRIDVNGVYITSSTFNGGGYILTANGILGIYNNDGTAGLTRLMFGNGSSNPAIKRNGAGLDIRLADDSGYAALNAGNVTSNGNPVGTGKDIYNMIW